MKIEISEEYINWIQSKTPEAIDRPLNKEELTKYINEVLSGHMNSYNLDVKE